MKHLNRFFSCSFLLIAFVANSQAPKTISRDWTSFVQSINVESKTPKKFKLEGAIKVVTDDKFASAGLWVRVDNKDDSRGFFDNMDDRPVKPGDWQNYTIEGSIDSKSKTLNFGGLCQFNGDFYFDNFRLYIENNKGAMELVELQNSSFEQPLKNGAIPKWIYGIYANQVVNVKEYAVSLSEDKTDGKYAAKIEGKGIKSKDFGKIGTEGASPQIGAMISMLEDLKDRVENKVKNMSQYELDYLHDENANRIGSLVMHLAAAEVYYQVYTFEGREFNDEEKKKWETALELDQGGRDTFHGHDAQYYLDIYNEVRAKTIAELKKRDDAWFAEVQKSGMSNQYCWFHVMEHQSSHLGQILFLAKRIPPQTEVKLDPKLKN